MLPTKLLIPIGLTLSSLFAFQGPGTTDHKQNGATETVVTGSGEVCGIHLTTAENHSVEAFLGIPYADAERWAAPTPKSPWSETFQASSYGPACPQFVPPIPGAEFPISEDCLSLNIWRPAQGENQDLPVMVFLHGGAYVIGSNRQAVYDGANLAGSQDVIVVVPNYRLGSFGFLYGSGAAGNYGLMDQQAALQWVRDNIAAFGGDPHNITLFGESAGAGMVAMHLAGAPSSQALFDRAILQSNPFPIQPQSTFQARWITRLFLYSLNCSDLDCARQMPMEAIIAAQSNPALGRPLQFDGFASQFIWSPLVDDDLVTREPWSALHEDGSPVPLILGFTRDEGANLVTPYVFAYGDAQGQINYPTYVTLLFHFFGRKARAVLHQYPGDPLGDNTAALAQIHTDYLFRCSARALAGTLEETYTYVFGEPSSFFVFGGPECFDLACHGDDLPFTFQTAANLGVPFSEAQKAVSQAMQTYWAQFAANGTPGGIVDDPVLPLWLPFLDGQTWLQLETPRAILQAPFTDTCQFWDGIGYDINHYPSLPLKTSIPRTPW
ncbi:Carboxylic ester hydrolase [Sulfidibacter corallicola]|uniref:Carboxylic ester hydrolase n=1 Tax=Sulfidibacter corallicola TaxID=2818388 RepID=A0A8A4TMK7_SULCO|nr:carboxylesterase family protein [Sulfidibacter corallicola]QTD51206.1 carboxylesterase family protein [Sulfidibacter corallicola]